mmetsp:Transcript_58715/g.139913  ORF Transcript_58715/g.139913 Transcript_58715/m.139913 type:complete len:187 (-) Transcript_58715:16-576(-)
MLAFPEPPSHWRLFGDGADVVKVPKPPAVKQYRAFGEDRQLDDAAVTAVAAELDEEAKAFDADDDLREELLHMSNKLKGASLGLLRCLVNNPAEHERSLREVDNLVSNFVVMFGLLRSREAKALIVARLAKQTAEKRKDLEELQTGLPRLRGEVERLHTRLRSWDAEKEVPESGDPPPDAKRRRLP